MGFGYFLVVHECFARISKADANIAQHTWLIILCGILPDDL